MTWHGLQAAVFAMLLFVVNTNCLVACSSEPCHDRSSLATHEATRASCHREDPPPRQDREPQRCEHAPLVADIHGAAKLSLDPDQVCGSAVLPAEAAVFPTSDPSQESTLHETSPPVVPGSGRTAILRI